MKRHVFAAPLVLTLMGLLSLAGPVAAQVPFKGSLEGVSTITPLDPPLDPPFGFVIFEAAGHATQLGRFTVTAPHIVNFADGTGIGEYLFTAANGDTLSADFTGSSTPTENPNVIHIVEIATLTGGTGRFAGATGSFTSDKLFDFGTFMSVGSFEGTISNGLGAAHLVPEPTSLALLGIASLGLCLACRRYRA